ncbi:hypothetical protein ERJ75_000254800 [Trypanosoma vivax]|uniref:CWF21 domain-containing protein n=1 Tax=Trypanosoma vivax (strain Y486) TaxID=1055687 RepID=G0U1Y5_TRYVY|nr:hypothetical protein TRVL_07936 [Trypanosoma vivax]KAH8618769.1 hypothetical protein ERJ75_000254800 [Trypanosoma vivax]CCC50286.1 conserved hypothetical protein [Trypanosoma vivax Y486]
MYNGVAALSVKGTGLSGYVQRSKSTAVQLSKFASSGFGGDAPPECRVNPLEALRSAKENAELASRLEQHKALRSIKLKVLLYREERMSAGIPGDVVERECDTLHASLYRNYLEESREARRVGAAEAAHKTAERFAAAFNVRPGALGDAFDRQQREAERQAADAARREVMERRVAAKVKRAKSE